MSTPDNSYEAWKESQFQAEAAGDEEWSEESAPVTWVGVSSIVEMKGVWAGLVVGVILLLAGVATLIPNIRHLTTGTRTVGTVVGHKDFTNRRTNNLVTPIVRYSAPGGVIDFVGGLSVPRSTYPPGKEVSVLYLPNNPSNAVIADFVQIFLIPSVVGGLGLVCFTGTAGIMYLVVRSELPGLRLSTMLPTTMTPRSNPTRSANVLPSPKDRATSVTSPSKTAATVAQFSSVGSE